MKRFLCLLTGCLLFAAAPVRGQGVSSQEAEENYKSLRGKVQDMIDAHAALEKRLQTMAREIADLREQVNKPTGNYASQEELKRLADTVQEIDRKREADTKRILDEFAKLGKVVASAPPAHSPRTPVVDNPTPVAQGNDTGFTYQIKQGDKVSLIAQTYREEMGIKVTTQQILDANPGLDPNKLVVGKKIFIPSPKGATPKKSD